VPFTFQKLEINFQFLLLIYNKIRYVGILYVLVVVEIKQIFIISS